MFNRNGEPLTTKEIALLLFCEDQGEVEATPNYKDGTRGEPLKGRYYKLSNDALVAYFGFKFGISLDLEEEYDPVFADKEKTEICGFINLGKAGEHGNL